MKPLHYTVLILIGFATILLVKAMLPESKPNIVLIMADDMGYECLGCNGSTEYKTPNLDRLAVGGLRFTNCYSQPLCTPSRVKIMTGKYNYRNYQDFGYLNPDQKTFGNLLQDAGYATCISGKWQLNGLNRNNEGNQDVSRPYHFGFDEYCLWQLHHKKSSGERFANPLITQNGIDLTRDEDAYGPDIFCEFVLDFIDREAGNPFFVYYPMVMVHDPFVPTPDSPEWDDQSRRYENDTVYFDDMMAYTDKIARRIIDKLKEKEVWENTLFIFTADNGTHPTVLSDTYNGQVKGGKGYSINTGNHVPFLLSWKDKYDGGRVVDELIDFADILPTFCETAGIKNSNFHTDGQSFLPLLKGNGTAGKKEILIHYTPRWGKNFPHNRWVMDGGYKLYRDGGFYNTTDDPLEENPLAELSPEEKKVRSGFQRIIDAREQEFPYDWNNESYNPDK